MTVSTESADGRRTKRRYAHELYPHAGEYETRPLAVEVPYLYARMVGLDVFGTNWHEVPERAGARVAEYVAAVRLALLADAIHQGLTGDEAWTWANERVTEDSEIAYERAFHYGVATDRIKPYPCGPEPADHYHSGEPNVRGWRPSTRAPVPESECPDCTEPAAEVAP